MTNIVITESDLTAAVSNVVPFGRRTHPELSLLGTSKRSLQVGHDPIDAISVPADFAQAIQTQLQISLLAGPVIADIAESRWIFLTDAPSSPLRISPELQRLRVISLPIGTSIPLPQNGGSDHLRSWINPPVKNRPLTPRSALIAVARRIAYTFPAFREGSDVSAQAA